jgi:hypothetical protein
LGRQNASSGTNSVCKDLEVGHKLAQVGTKWLTLPENLSNGTLHTREWAREHLLYLQKCIIYYLGRLNGIA